jgi:hypothetical protein
MLTGIPGSTGNSSFSALLKSPVAGHAAKNAAGSSMSVEDMIQYTFLINQLLNQSVEAMAGYPVINMGKRAGNL